MKASWLYSLATLLTPAVVVGQGLFTFNNYLPTQGINAPFIYPFNYCGGRFLPIEGSVWTFQLLAGPDGVPVAQLQPLEPLTALNAGAPGYVLPITLKVPAVPPGSVAVVVSRIF